MSVWLGYVYPNRDGCCSPGVPQWAPPSGSISSQDICRRANQLSNVELFQPSRRTRHDAAPTHRIASGASTTAVKGGALKAPRSLVAFWSPQDSVKATMPWTLRQWRHGKGKTLDAARLGACWEPPAKSRFGVQQGEKPRPFLLQWKALWTRPGEDKMETEI